MNERSLGIAAFIWFRVDANPKFSSEMVNMEQLRQIKDIPTQIKNPELVARRRRQIAEAAVQLFIKKGFHPGRSHRLPAFLSALCMNMLLQKRMYCIWFAKRYILRLNEASLKP
jgi:hypothetical protein